MLRYLLLIAALALMICSCSKDLKENTTLAIVDSTMAFSVGGQGDEEYFLPSDSADLREGVIDDITNDFDGSNNVNVVTGTAQYTLKITQCNFYEGVTHRIIANPCDSSYSTPDSLHYDLHSLSVSLYCILYDHSNNAFISLQAEASDEEELKDGPTFLQSLFSDCDCYEPHVKAIHFYEKLRNRVLRRIHRRAISQIQSWQEM
jgi:hypothetical protein